jgi:hypothetical protein
VAYYRVRICLVRIRGPHVVSLYYDILYRVAVLIQSIVSRTSGMACETYVYCLCSTYRQTDAAKDVHRSEKIRQGPKEEDNGTPSEAGGGGVHIRTVFLLP